MCVLESERVRERERENLISHEKDKSVTNDNQRLGCMPGKRSGWKKEGKKELDEN